MKVVATKISIFEYLKFLSEKYPNYRFGLAGSFSRDEQTDDSDIDIVVDTDQLNVDDMEFIKNSFNFDRDIDVLSIPLLKEEDEQEDKFLTELGLPINDESVYKTVTKDVIWYEEKSINRC